MSGSDALKAPVGFQCLVEFRKSQPALESMATISRLDDLHTLARQAPESDEIIHFKLG